MATLPLADVELRELVCGLVSTLEAVSDELDVVFDTRMPVGEKIARELAERDALAAALKRLPEDLRARIRTIYAEEFAKVDRGDEVVESPEVLVDQRSRVEDVLEGARFAAWRDSELYVMLSRASLG